MPDDCPDIDQWSLSDCNQCNRLDCPNCSPGVSACYHVPAAVQWDCSYLDYIQGPYSPYCPQAPQYGTTTSGGGGGGADQGIFDPGVDIINNCCYYSGEIICFNISYSDLNNSVSSSSYLLNLFTMPPGYTGLIDVGYTPTFTVYQNFTGVGANDPDQLIWVEPTIAVDTLFAPMSPAPIGVSTFPSSGPSTTLPITYNVTLNTNLDNTVYPGDTTSALITFGAAGIGAVGPYCETYDPRCHTLTCAECENTSTGSSAPQAPYNYINFSYLTSGYGRLCFGLTLVPIEGPQGVPPADCVSTPIDYCEIEADRIVTADPHTTVWGSGSMETTNVSTWSVVSNTEVVLDLEQTFVDDPTPLNDLGTWFRLDIDGTSFRLCLPAGAIITKLSMDGDLTATDTSTHESPGPTAGVTPYMGAIVNPYINVDGANFFNIYRNGVPMLGLPSPSNSSPIEDFDPDLTNGTNVGGVYTPINTDFFANLGAAPILNSNSMLSAITMSFYFFLQYNFNLSSGIKPYPPMTGYFTLSNLRLKIWYCLGGAEVP